MSDTLVDARGLRCPLPVIRLAAAARGLPAGTELTVLSTDPAARLDVPAWCRMRGHEHVATVEHRAEGTDRDIPGSGDVAGDGSASGDEAWTGWAVTVRLG
ncbi:sulfurtransferase TusA family protein [Promicromonospora sp. NPDC050880]|uniref:sulfurtransferase TusA family protein n=1 Tax=Promicromonospora sp. NPDC050880 TaxID=3364406 RepID=UPI0037A2F1D7